MLAALLTNLPTGRSGVHRLWFNESIESFEERIEVAAKKNHAVAVVWDQVKFDPDIEFRLRDAAIAVGLEIDKNRQSGKVLEMLRRTLDDIDDEESLTVLLH